MSFGVIVIAVTSTGGTRGRSLVVLAARGKQAYAKRNHEDPALHVASPNVLTPYFVSDFFQVESGLYRVMDSAIEAVFAPSSFS